MSHGYSDLTNTIKQKLNKQDNRIEVWLKNAHVRLTTIIARPSGMCTINYGFDTE